MSAPIRHMRGHYCGNCGEPVARFPALHTWACRLLTRLGIQ